jgi:Overcoming lysogenization defect protein-like, TOPRIM domain
VSTQAVVLVEGNSDRLALLTLARRLGRDLATEGTEIVPMGGIGNVRAFARRYGPRGLGISLAGLYDAPEAPHVVRGLAAAGLSPARTHADLAELGFFACTADLEDELVRALGLDHAEAVIEAAGEGRSLRLLAGMPAQQAWTREAVLRRFFGSQSGRKARYAELMVEALDLHRVPGPLTALLTRVLPRTS